MTRKIELLCAVGVFSGGDIVEIGKGKDQLSEESFKTLDEHHYKEVNEKVLASDKGLKDELKSVTDELNRVKAKNVALETGGGDSEEKIKTLGEENQTLSSEKGVLSEKVDELTTKVDEAIAERDSASTAIDGLIVNINSLDISQNADKLKAAVKELQESVKNG